MNGPDLLEALQSVRAFHTSVSSLLLTADGLMTDRGFKPHPLTKRAAVTLQTQSIDQPGQWMPSFVFRWYDLKRTDRAAYIAAILLDPVDVQASNPLSATIGPLVSFGVAHFKDGVPRKSSELYHFARAIQWTDVVPDGEDWADHRPSPVKHGPILIRSAAVPLVSLTDSLTVEVKVVQRLHEHIQQSMRDELAWGTDAS